MNDTLLLALTAGMLAAFNPCGFALLPAYLALVVAPAGPGSDGVREDGVGEDGVGEVGVQRPVPPVVRALAASAAMTAGFVAVFGAFGLLVVPLALSLGPALSWATVVVGLLLVALGVWLLLGHELVVRLPHVRGGAPTGGIASMAGYGVAYAVASLSCTIAPFLAVTTTTFRSESVLAGLAVFLAYAAGMGLVVGVLALAVALAEDRLVRRLRSVLPYVSRASGALLVLAGAYVTYYGAYELRLLAGGSTEDPVVDAALGVQAALTRLLGRIGVEGMLTVLVVLLLVGGVAAVTTRTTRRARSGRV